MHNEAETPTKSDEPTRELHDDGGMYPTESSHVDAKTHTTEALKKEEMGEHADDWASGATSTSTFEK